MIQWKRFTLTKRLNLNRNVTMCQILENIHNVSNTRNSYKHCYIIISSWKRRGGVE